MTPPYLVQMRDADGFWVNVSEHASWAFACKVAQVEANETWQLFRTVWGLKREGARLFSPQRARQVGA